MFIATSIHPGDLAPSGAKPGSGTIADAAKAIAVLRSLGVKKGQPRYKHLAPLRPLSGEATNGGLLHFQLEFAPTQSTLVSQSSRR